MRVLQLACSTYYVNQGLRSLLCGASHVQPLKQPGDRVSVHAQKVFFRRRKLRSKVEMRLSDGSVVCSGALSGMGVPR